MECRHIIALVPARVIAGLCPDGVAAPTVVDPVFAQVESPAGYPLLPEHFFCDLCHDAGVPVPVGAAVDEQDIEWCSIVGEPHEFPIVNEFAGRAVAVGASLRRFLPGENKSAYRAFPAGLVGGWFWH